MLASYHNIMINIFSQPVFWEPLDVNSSYNMTKMQASATEMHKYFIYPEDVIMFIGFYQSFPYIKQYIK